MPQQERFQGMSLVISDKFNWQKLTPDDGYDYFFGYYDRNPWDNTISRHLTLKVPHINRLPRVDEPAEIGFVTQDGKYTALVTTRVWCHQQGCMSLFLPFMKNCFIYNDFDDEKGMVSRIFEIGKGIIRTFDRPIYAITPDGKKAVSLNFGRIPRRGYSYALTPVSGDRHPSDLAADGIWIMDLKTGKSELTVSYKDMLAVHPSPYGIADRYIWLNHAIFNCDGSRLLWLFRTIDKVTDPRWQTYMYTSSINGGDAECILPDVYWRNRGITHQIWGRTPREILIDADWEALGNAAVVFDESHRPFVSKEISPAWRSPSHMVFSPDGKWLLADSCLGVDELNRRGLLLIDPENGNSVELGRFMMNLPQGLPGGDIRCDLHPRWSNDGKYCTVDAWHESTRGIYLLDLSDAHRMLLDQRGNAR